MFLGAIIPLSFERKLCFLRDSHVCSLMPAEGYLLLRPCPKKRKKEHLARCVASGAFLRIPLCQWNRSYGRKKKKKRFYRGGPPPARPEGLSGSRGSFYVKSQIQVVFPHRSLVKHLVPSREDKGRLLETIILFACHRRGSAAVPALGPDGKCRAGRRHRLAR